MPHKIEYTKNLIRKRQFNPSKCKKDTFRTKYVSSRTKIVLCVKKGEKKQAVQTILHPRRGKHFDETMGGVF
jgi:hypothetical protein